MPRRSRDGGRAADVEVVLVEDEPERTPARDPLASPDRPGAPVTRRRPGLGTRTRAVAVVAVLAVLGVAGVLQARQQAVVAAALEGHPGLLRPLHVLPTERWRLAEAWVAGLGERDVLVAAPDGLLRGVDPETGLPRWSAGEPPPGGSSWCTVLHRSPDGSGLTRVGGDVHRAATLAVCEQGRWSEGPLRSRVRLTTATVLDPATGAVLAERALDGGLLVSDVVGDDLLHAWADLSGRVSVVRWDPRTGEARWTFRSDRRVTERRSNGVTVHHGDGTLSFVGSGTLTVDVASGEQVDRPGAARAAPTVVGHLADGAVVVRSVDGDGAPVTQVRSDGAVRYTVEGDPLLPPIQVGAPAPALLLLAADGDEVRAVDAATGQDLWQERLSRPGALRPADVTVLAELDGTAVLTDTVEAWAVQLTDGRERWRLPLADVTRLQPLTDGSVMALPVADGSPAGALVAVDVRSGVELWRTALPPGTEGVRPAHGLVIVESDDGITALG